MAEPTPTDGGPQDEAAAVVEDLEALRGRLATLEQERDQYLALLQRTRADFENYQKRVQRDLAHERLYMAKGLVQALLPVLDNLGRAIDAARKTNPNDPLLQGVGMVQSQLLDVLTRNGVTPIEALHKPFDPHRHEAVMQEPSGVHPPNTVVRVLEQGFMMNDQVLRPARVAVSGPADGQKN
jgi:molecular chaperone GrpE